MLVRVCLRGRGTSQALSQSSENAYVVGKHREHRTLALYAHTRRTRGAANDFRMTYPQLARSQA